MRSPAPNCRSIRSPCAPAVSLLLCWGAFNVATPATAEAQYRDKAGNEIGRVRIEQVRRERGIKAAAEEVGEYKGVVKLDKDVVALDLATIADRSDLVMSGTVVSSSSSVSEDGTWVFTDYRFRVSEVFKGLTRPEEIVVLRLPLGRVEFDRGAVANVVGENFAGFTEGHEYLLYLMAARADAQPRPSRVDLTWGTQGAFELRATGSVRPLGSPAAPVSRLYANTSRGTLLAETKAAVATAATFRASHAGKR